MKSKGSRQTIRLLVIPIIIVATLSLVFFKAENTSIIATTLLANSYVDGELKYQLITLGVASIVLLFTFLFAPIHFKKFFALGNINAPVEPVRLIGLTPKPDEGWLQIGRNFVLIISVVTFVFIYFQAIKGNGIAIHNLHYLPWILVFAISNAFVEEMITRFAVISALDGLLSSRLIFLISGAIFGLVHYFGTPSGIAGVVLASFLGWLLAKSMYETRGILWAWLIHCLQDIIIFVGLFFVYL